MCVSIPPTKKHPLLRVLQCACVAAEHLLNRSAQRGFLQSSSPHPLQMWSLQLQASGCRVRGQGTGTATALRCCSSGTPLRRGRALLRSTPAHAGEKLSLARQEGAMASWHLVFIRKLHFFLHPYPRPGGLRRAGPATWAGVQGWTRDAGGGSISSDRSLFLTTLERCWCGFPVLFTSQDKTHVTRGNNWLCL